MVLKLKKIPSFLKEVRGELKKVSWSTRDELTFATYMVIVASAILTIYILMIDTIFSKVMKYFLS